MNIEIDFTICQPVAKVWTTSRPSPCFPPKPRSMPKRMRPRTRALLLQLEMRKSLCARRLWLSTFAHAAFVRIYIYRSNYIHACLKAERSNGDGSTAVHEAPASGVPDPPAATVSEAAAMPGEHVMCSAKAADMVHEQHSNHAGSKSWSTCHEPVTCLHMA